LAAGVEGRSGVVFSLAAFGYVPEKADVPPITDLDRWAGL